MSAVLSSATGLETSLRAALEPTHLEVIDESAAHAGHMGANDQGHGTHFRVRIGSPRFAALSRVAAHRLVYDCLQRDFQGSLHALAIEIVK
jgi:BolA family transcriptional regulator, general stress-responsive regulator